MPEPEKESNVLKGIAGDAFNLLVYTKVSINNVHSFVLAFRRCLSKIGGKRYLAAVDEAIKIFDDSLCSAYSCAKGPRDSSASSAHSTSRADCNR
ncbi:hypothetical protein HPB51_003229 [Rhipicephalus microplus]|uniref:Uncharacterized protein n=1 Tax=Rhipicephalus microplus TaxID=6941 RepID=A0A9J6EFQ8_RHIMP|nr:hypothetical protein HPB51_003229 [Rhipicephalus microplus]